MRRYARLPQILIEDVLCILGHLDADEAVATRGLEIFTLHRVAECARAEVLDHHVAAGDDLLLLDPEVRLRLQAGRQSVKVDLIRARVGAVRARDGTGAGSPRQLRAQRARRHAARVGVPRPGHWHAASRWGHLRATHAVPPRQLTPLFHQVPPSRVRQAAALLVRTVSGNSSVAAASRFLSSRSPKNTGSGFVSNASGTEFWSMGSASKSRPGRVDVPGTGSASPTGGEDDGFVGALLDAFDFDVVEGAGHLPGSALVSFTRLPYAESSFWLLSHRETTASACAEGAAQSLSKSSSSVMASSAIPFCGGRLPSIPRGHRRRSRHQGVLSCRAANGARPGSWTH